MEIDIIFTLIIFGYFVFNFINILIAWVLLDYIKFFHRKKFIEAETNLMLKKVERKHNNG